MMVVVDIEPGIEMDLAEFKNDLEESQSITISPYAEETVFEETYRFESMLFLKTVTGYTIVLKLSLYKNRCYLSLYLLCLAF